ncbi:hypothetical protein [Marinobacter phage PS6]|nr:hypothetical protein [Marinobacter phage PS6]
MRMYQTNHTRNRTERTIEAFKTLFTIGAGSADSVEVYHDKEHVYVYSENSGLEYAGLEIFERETGEHCFDMFLQSDDGSGDLEWLLNTSRVPSKIRFLSQWYM